MFQTGIYTEVYDIILTLFIIQVVSNSGIARLSGTQGEQSQWPPLTEILDFKKIMNIYLIFIFPLLRLCCLFWLQYSSCPSDILYFRSQCSGDEVYFFHQATGLSMKYCYTVSLTRLVSNPAPVSENAVV
jgi:hypothetical protein